MAGSASLAQGMTPHVSGTPPVAKFSPASKVIRTGWKVWRFPPMASSSSLARGLRPRGGGTPPVGKNSPLFRECTAGRVTPGVSYLNLLQEKGLFTFGAVMTWHEKYL